MNTPYLTSTSELTEADRFTHVLYLEPETNIELQMELCNWNEIYCFLAVPGVVPRQGGHCLPTSIRRMK